MPPSGTTPEPDGDEDADAGEEEQPGKKAEQPD